VISSKEFHGGVVGLAAAKIVEKFHRPTILLHEGEDGKLVGSARSIPGYNVRESLDTAAHLMVKYGGHAGAAGMTLQTENLEALRAQLNDHFARTVGPVVDVKHHPFDRDVPFGMLSVKLVKELRAVFEPCGMGNPFVTFRTKGCLVEDDKLVGKKERVHLKTTLSQGGRRMDGIGFFMDHAYPLPRDREVIVTYNPDNNTFRGRTSVQMKIKEIYAEDPEPVALPPLPPFSAPVMPAPPGGEAPMLGGPRAFQ
jgi:single-stranded-DNA-specific exonuclease